MVADESIDTGTGGRTELRVHGVSGTSPEAVLGHPLLRRVAGDARAGFYRRWYPGGRSADLAAGTRLEAYSWGRLTSGPAARAAWLLLLPFMLANLAHWMLPAIPADAHRRQALAGRASASLLRLFGLGLTLTLLLTAVQAAVDLIGWQCAGQAGCADDSALAGALADGFLAQPGVRVVISSLVPLLVVLAVGLLGRGTLRQTAAEPEVAVAHAAEQPLTRPSFWRGNPGLASLRTAHVAAATALLAALVAWPATRLAASGADRVLGAAICLAGLGVLGFAVVLVATEAATGRPARRLETANLARRAAIAVLVVATVYSLVDHGTWEPEWRLPGARPAILAVFVGELVLLLALALAVASQRPWTQGEGGFRVAMRGLGAPAVATIAFLVAGGFSAGITYRVAGLLGYPVLSQVSAAAEVAATQRIVQDEALPFATRLAAANAEWPMVVPPSFAWAGAAATVIFVALLVILATVVWGVRSRIAPLSAEVLRDHPAEPSAHGPDDPLVRRVATAIALASVTDGVGRVIGRVVLASGVILLVGLGVYAAGEDNWRFVEDPPLSTFTAFGTWLMGLFALGMVALAWSSARNPTLRRSVGILWDVGSFWPRAAHPLAPPSYGERAVADLTARITMLAKAPDADVVVSGHSQGSVLAAAAVLQLPGQVAERVSAITAGSPLRRLYARFFPAYLGLAEAGTVAERTGGRWRNLYRDTDPIGSWALEPPTTPEPRADRRLIDPSALDQPVKGHADYWNDPAYDVALGEVERHVRSPDAR